MSDSRYRRNVTDWRATGRCLAVLEDTDQRNEPIKVAIVTTYTQMGPSTLDRLFGVRFSPNAKCPDIT